jgi:hypothetical protein
MLANCTEALEHPMAFGDDAVANAYSSPETRCDQDVSAVPSCNSMEGLKLSAPPSS